MIKKIAFIINPASGQEYPILSVANRFFRKHKISWEAFITQHKNEAEKFTRQAVQDGVDAVVVYGGDGTVMEVAHGLSLSQIPLAIIPGGTANIVAKEFGIPQDPVAALELLLTNSHEIKTIDTFSVNGHSYFIRINVGLFADMVKKTKRVNKTRFGSWAYAATVLQNLDPLVSKYSFRIGNKTEELKGVGVVITNIGNIGLSNSSLLPDVNSSDGVLDILVLPQSNITSWAALAKGALLKSDEAPLPHFQADSVELAINPQQTIIVDDETYKKSQLSIQVHPNTLSFVVPK